MRQLYLFLLVGMIGFQSLLAAPAKKAKVTPPATWAQTAAAYKDAIVAKQKVKGFPIESELIKKGELKTIKANVANLDYIVLVVTANPGDPINNDAVWANAKVYTKDGQAVDVTSLKINGQASTTQNYHRHPVMVNNQTISNFILSHTSRFVYVPLDKKYVRFESNIAVDDESDYQTAIFRIQSESGQTEFDQLAKAFPDECYTFFPLCPTNGQMWLSNGSSYGTDVIIKKLIQRLKVKTYFNQELEKINSLSKDKQTVSYLSMFKDVFDVIRLQSEIEWLNIDAIKMAFDDMKANPSFNVSAIQPKLDELTKLVQGGFDGISSKNQQAIENAQKAIALKKEILFANPLLDMDKILVERYKIGFNARSVNPGSLGTEPANWSCLMSAWRKGFNAEIAQLSNLRGEVQTTTLYKPETSTSISHLTLHWNADKMMFTMSDNNNLWQVYETDVDGKNLRKVIQSDESDLEFFDATYLPNGKIMAVSNVGYLGVPCVDGSDIVGNMVLYNPQDKDIRRITFDQESNWGPIVMNNGRVMFTRWEYTDLTHYFSRIVMHMNPDGTEQKALYGSGSYFPNSIFDIKPLPGNGTSFVAVISGHHGVVRSGRMMIFDPSVSRRDAEGITHEFPYRGRKVVPIVKDDLVDGVWPQFIKPYPLNEKYYLVTAKLTPEGLWGLYMVDTFDNLTLIKEAEGEGYIHGTPVVKRTIPPIIPDKVKLN